MKIIARLKDATSEIAKEYGMSMDYAFRNLYQKILKPAKTKYRGKGRPRKTDYHIARTEDKGPYKVLNR